METRALDLGREALRKRAWGAAYFQLLAADRDAPLGPEDIEQLAKTGHLLGRDSDSAELLARAHQVYLGRGETRSAARCALWLGFTNLINGEHAQAGGWLARATRLLENEADCAEKGYLFLPAGYRAVHEGDTAKAYQAFLGAAAVGTRFGDRDLVTMALQGQGRVLIRQGEIARGVALLDEAMVAVTNGEVSPTTAGSVYCSVIESCQETLDLGRAQEWTAALHQWCASQPDLVPYRGHCLLQRAEIMERQGEWQSALNEARTACERLSVPAPKPALGAAFYRIGELHRLRGEFPQAEDAYRQASQWNRSSQPGLAKLRLAQGQIDAAMSGIRRIAEEVQEPCARGFILDAYVEIMLVVRDVAAARAGADELVEIAERHGAPLLRAMSLRAHGAVLLEEGDAPGALSALRRSWTAWCDLNAPYDAARARLLIALACRELGDNDAADLELSVARDIFQKLGAVPELARLGALSGKKACVVEGPLSAREVEVLKLVAAGMTNRKIAGKLGISEKTVARHLSNIFNKLNLSSRAAATAYAYENGVVTSTT